MNYYSLISNFEGSLLCSTLLMLAILRFQSVPGELYSAHRDVQIGGCGYS